jgi:hypothetical protein
MLTTENCTTGCVGTSKISGEIMQVHCSALNNSNTWPERSPTHVITAHKGGDRSTTFIEDEASQVLQRRLQHSSGMQANQLLAGLEGCVPSGILLRLPRC